MPHKKERRYQAARELRVQAGPDGSRTISGYAIRYNEPSVDLGGFTEIVAPGAVTDSLRENADILCLRGHDPNLLMGRTKSKTLTLTEDANGLRFSCKLPNNASGNDLAESIERGDLDGASFGFTTDKDSWTSDKQGNVTRTLLKITLSEVSPTSFPAYQTSSVSIRSCPSELRSLLKRSVDEDEDEDGCDCDCPECLAGDCSLCSDEDCIDPDCEHGEDSARSVSLFKLDLRIALANRL